MQSPGTMVVVGLGPIHSPGSVIAFGGLVLCRHLARGPGSSVAEGTSPTPTRAAGSWQSIAISVNGLPR
jgi:hypothetical protein